VPKDQFLAYFASDRSHMRTPEGGWLVLPPESPPIRTRTEVMNLFRFVDMEKVFLGEVYDFQTMHAFLER
jgi:hypothetical protein